MPNMIKTKKVTHMKTCTQSNGKNPSLKQNTQHLPFPQNTQIGETSFTLS